MGKAVVPFDDRPKLPLCSREYTDEECSLEIVNGEVRRKKTALEETSEVGNVEEGDIEDEEGGMPPANESEEQGASEFGMTDWPLSGPPPPVLFLVPATRSPRIRESCSHRRQVPSQTTAHGFL